MFSPLSRLPPPPPLVRDAGQALLGRVPGPLQHGLVAWVLNRVFARQLAAGQIDFLQQRRLEIGIDDLGWRWLLELRAGRIRVGGPAQPEPGGQGGVQGEPDGAALIHGQLQAFLLLAVRRADPDTLFFQRRLVIEGDTELALAVKNFLDGVDPEQLPTPLPQLFRLAERLG